MDRTRLHNGRYKKFLSLIDSFVRNLLSFFLAILITAPCFGADKPWPISVEHAYKIFYSNSEIKKTGEQNHGKGLQTGSGLLTQPTTEEPFYIFYLDSFYCTRTATSSCQQDNKSRKLIYIDANDGQIISEDQMMLVKNERLSASKKAQAELEKQLKNEENLLLEIESGWQEISAQRWVNGGKFTAAVKKNEQLFLLGLSALKPEVKSRSIRVVSDLARNRNANFSYKMTAAIPKLIILLKDEDYAVRYHAAEALGQIAEKGDNAVINALLGDLKDSDVLVRRGVIDSLANLGGPSLAPVMIALLPQSEVRENAINALGKLADQSAVDPLINLFSTEENCNRQRSIVDALASINDVRAIPFFVDILNKKYSNGGNECSYQSPYVGYDAAKALAKIGTPAIPALVNSLESNDRLVRLYTVWALTLLKDFYAQKMLQQALQREKDETIRIYLERALVILSGKEFTPSFLQELRVTIEPEGNLPTQIGSPVRLIWSIENTGSMPLTINTASIKVIQPAFEVKPLNGQSTGFKVMIDWSPQPNKESLVEVLPGKSYRIGPFDLQDYFDFGAPGAYEILGVYYNRFPAIEYATYAVEGSIKSEPILLNLK